jgi:hypothetical protein
MAAGRGDVPDHPRAHPPVCPNNAASGERSSPIAAFDLPDQGSVEALLGLGVEAAGDDGTGGVILMESTIAWSSARSAAVLAG